MSRSSDEELARALHAHDDGREAIAALARVAAERDPGASWPERLDLPVEREVELLARALLDRFEAGTHSAELRVELHVTRWRGRADGCELGLPGEGDGSRQASPLLTRVVRAGDEALASELALGCAAALVRGALERLDPELVVGEVGALRVTVAFPDGPEWFLGSFDGGWEPD